MLPIAREGYSRQEIIDALHGKYAPVNMRFRYDLLDKNNNFKKSLTNVLRGEVSCNSLAQIKRTARFTLEDDKEIDYLSDRIQPFVELQTTKIETKSLTWNELGVKKWSDLR